jgi:hypothetical protein
MENIALLTNADKELNLEIESHESEIKKLTITIEGMASTIEGMASTIEGMASTIESLKNADNVLTSNQKDSTLRFHVETNLGIKTQSFITYETQLTDTHNAIDINTGIFTAPFSGAYGFVFYARFYCDLFAVAIPRDLYVDHNGARSIIFRCASPNILSSSIYFALRLKQGDTVRIFSEYSEVSDLHPAKFTGFLLQKD